MGFETSCQISNSSHLQITYLHLVYKRSLQFRYFCQHFQCRFCSGVCILIVVLIDELKILFGQFLGPPSHVAAYLPGLFQLDALSEVFRIVTNGRKHLYYVGNIWP